MKNRWPILLHATAVALPAAGEWVGVLLRGPSGSGKSDLALRLIDQGARLIADDQTELCQTVQGLTMSAPARIAGRLEVRGLGLVTMAIVDKVPLVLVADLVSSVEVERMPRPLTVTLAGVSISMMRLAPFEVSATAKLRLAVQQATVGAMDTLDRLAVS